MYKSKKISIVIPCFNEEIQISKVIKTLPKFVDYIVVIDDKSTDNTRAKIKELAKEDERIIMISHDVNSGVGASIASGYKWTRDNNIDIAVVMAGDGQMDPEELPKILDPIISGEYDYAKGNRLKYPGAYQIIPKTRFFGNQILSFFTKIASGYWRITDAQNGYAAISLNALRIINWDEMYKKYGQPNDLLVKLNIAGLKVCDCIMRPVYNVGEKSKMNIKKVLFTLPPLLLRLFFKRIFHKYIVQDFNIIAPLYFFGIFNFLIFILFFSRTIIKFMLSSVPEITLMICLSSLQMAIFFIVMAMYFDMQANEHLQSGTINKYK